MDAMAALEAELAKDPYTPLRVHLAENDDRLLEALVSLRKSKQLTQDEIATRMSRSKTAVSNFERLGSDPHLSTIRRYAAAVGGRIITRIADFDDELAAKPIADSDAVSIAVPKSGQPSATHRGPRGVWDRV